MKLLLGGSPCTFWSISQTKNRETKPEGMGWELFKNYLIARDKYKPDYFLYENNYSMSKAIREQITTELGVEPIMIDSAKLSAQSRKRLYWVGKRNEDGTYSQVQVTQPEDKGILLRDILESGVCWKEKAYCLTASQAKGVTLEHHLTHSVRNLIAEPVRIGTIESGEKSISQDSQGVRVYSPDAKGGGAGAKTGLYATPVRVCDINGGGQGNRIYSTDAKSCAIKAQSGGLGGHGQGLYAIPTDKKTYPVYEVNDGQITIKDKQYPIKLADGFYIIRKLTVTECKRLQTVFDEYEFPVSNSQAYKMLGNGWSVDVIVHILSHIPDITTEPVEVLSMYDGMSCGRIALNKLEAHITNYYATEIDKYAIQTTQHNYPDTISSLETLSKSERIVGSYQK